LARIARNEKQPRIVRSALTCFAGYNAYSLPTFPMMPVRAENSTPRIGCNARMGLCS
jgi:hypothetical protein